MDRKIGSTREENMNNKIEKIIVISIALLAMLLCFLLGNGETGNRVGNPNANGWYIYEVPIYVTNSDGESYTRYEYWLTKTVPGSTLVGPGCQLTAVYRNGQASCCDYEWEIQAWCGSGVHIKDIPIDFTTFAKTFPEVIATGFTFRDLLIFTMYGRYGKNLIHLLSTTKNNTRENAELWYKCTSQLGDELK